MNNADFLELSLKRAQSSGKKKWENLTTARYCLVLINARSSLWMPLATPLMLGSHLRLTRDV